MSPVFLVLFGLFALWLVMTGRAAAMIKAVTGGS